MRMHLPEGLKKISRTLTGSGRHCFLVGGAVRDHLLGKKVTDYDLATDAPPEEVMKLFRRVIPTGLKHGTVTVLEGGRQYEVTTFRTESGYSDGRRPDAVSWTADVDEDLRRRDFTINAMAYNPATHRLHDPFGGRADLAARIIRALGDPRDRLSEDALRILRAVRFSVQLAFSIEPKTHEAMTELCPLIDRISRERIRDELDKILTADEPSAGFLIMREIGLLRRILPELDDCAGVAQPGLHCFDVFLHSLYACDGAPRDNPAVRIAALLHDAGKPLCAGYSAENEIRFYGHEIQGERLAREIMTRLRYPNTLIDKVAVLVRCHMFNYDHTWTNAAVRRLIRRAGPDNMADLLALRRADQFGMCRQRTDAAYLVELERRIQGEFDSRAALSLNDLAINGKDLMRELPLPEGEQIGIVLDFLLESVLDDPALNEPGRLLALARRFVQERLG